MFDFRYHALSLAAVFLALGIGIVLGATLGDSVISEANKDVRSSLQGDLLDARSDAQKANNGVNQRDRFINAAAQYLAANKLSGERILIVSSGTLPGSIESGIRTAVKTGAGTVDAVARFDAQPKLAKLVAGLPARFQALAATPDGIRTLGQRIGRSLVRGDRVAHALRNQFPDAFNGDLAGADAVVYYRSADNRTDEAKTFESALIEGLRSGGVPVVGAEQSDAGRSQIPFYERAAISTVDDLDQPAGKIALVLALGGAAGNFGFKKTADAPLPAPSGAR
jgi:hypothetical protein